MRLFLLTTLLAFSIGGCTLFGGQEPSDIQEEDFSRYVQVSYAEDNPFVMLRPTADARNINVIAVGFGEIETADIQLTYFAGDVEQGVFDALALEDGIGEKQIFLGSCSSSTGVRRCYYHEGVENGELQVVYDDGGEKEKRIVESFTLQEVRAAEGNIESLDRVVTITFDPAQSGVLYVMSIPLTGIPGPLPPGMEIVGRPYAFLPAVDVRLNGKLDFTFTDIQDASGIELYQWNEDAATWRRLEGKVDRSHVTAQISSFGIFLAAKASSDE